MRDFFFCLAANLPDLHESDFDEIETGGSGFESWMFGVLLAATVATLLLIACINKIRGMKKSLGVYVAIGVFMFIAIFQVLIIYSTFSKNIFPPLLIGCGLVLWIYSQGNRHPRCKPTMNRNRVTNEVGYSTAATRTNCGRQPIVVGSEPNDIFHPKVGSIIEAPYGISVCGIEPGSFHMGSPNYELGHRENENLVLTRLSRGYWIAKTQCTQAQWMCVMGENPSGFVSPQHPVERVSWEDAVRFCAILTKIQHASGILPREARWALPSEAQWEFACRAGSNTGLNSGKAITNPTGFCNNLDDVAWFGGNSNGRTHPVAGKKPNAWGLYDMHGNVWEWCRDWYHFLLDGGEDPCNDMKGDYRSIRGGGWGDQPWACRSAARHQNPLPKDSDFGFRPIICW